MREGAGGSTHLPGSSVSGLSSLLATRLSTAFRADAGGVGEGGGRGREGARASAAQLQTRAWLVLKEELRSSRLTAEGGAVRLRRTCSRLYSDRLTAKRTSNRRPVSHTRLPRKSLWKPRTTCAKAAKP